ncbi:MAG: hypothetical protein RDU89_01910 [bacterium]|nr:hypothetical protein [bacterium]
MSQMSRVLTDLLAMTRALERSLADPGREPDMGLLEARAELVDRLRNLLEDGDPGRVAVDLAPWALELQEADRQLRRTAAVRLHVLHQAVADLSRQRIALRGYLGGLGGGHGISYC